jgi:hypothetical protein
MCSFDEELGRHDEDLHGSDEKMGRSDEDLLGSDEELQVDLMKSCMEVMKS